MPDLSLVQWAGGIVALAIVAYVLLVAWPLVTRLAVILALLLVQSFLVWHLQPSLEEGGFRGAVVLTATAFWTRPPWLPLRCAPIDSPAASSPPAPATCASRQRFHPQRVGHLAHPFLLISVRFLLIACPL
jgi:hypothetical protein